MISNQLTVMTVENIPKTEEYEMPTIFVIPTKIIYLEE